jgi:hypothetical protein
LAGAHNNALMTGKITDSMKRTIFKIGIFIFRFAARFLTYGMPGKWNKD